jgi:hypothetical protein
MTVLADTAVPPKECFKNVYPHDNSLTAFILVIRDVSFSQISSEASAAYIVQTVAFSVETLL